MDQLLVYGNGRTQFPLAGYENFDRYISKVQLNIRNREAVGGYRNVHDYNKIFLIIKRSLENDRYTTGNLNLINRLEKIRISIRNDADAPPFDETDSYMETAVRKTMRLMDKISDREEDEWLLSITGPKIILETELTLGVRLLKTIDFETLLGRGRSLLRTIDPSILANNIEKIPLSFLRSERQMVNGFSRIVKRGAGLSPQQVHVLAISQLRANQLLAIGLFSFSNQQLYSFDLSRFNQKTVEKLLRTIEPERIRYFSPSTIACNLRKINSFFLRYFSDAQLGEIDYKMLSLHEREHTTEQMGAKMKNYPEKFACDPAKLANFRKNLLEAIRQFIPGDLASNLAYNALKKRVSNRDVRDDPRRVFDANVKNVTADTVKDLYRQLALAAHPDKHKADRLKEAEALFVVLGSALEILSPK